MNLLDAILSIIIIGIIVSVYAFLPQRTFENSFDSNRIIEYSKMISEVEYELKKIPPEDLVVYEDTMDSVLITIKTKYENLNNSRFELDGEVVIINGENFAKVKVKDRNINQEYFFGIATP